MKSKDDPEVFALHPIIQETIVPDLLKTGRKYVYQITPDKLRVCKGDVAFRVSRLFAPGRESYLCFCNVKDSAVRDSDFMCIAAKIFDGIAKTIKSFLNIGTPILFIEYIL